MKLVYVLGLSCSGKSYTADRLNDVALVIRGNVIVDAMFGEFDWQQDDWTPHEKTQILINTLNGEFHYPDSKLWLARAKEAIYKVIIAEYGYAASKAHAIVVEGEVFCMFVIRQIVERALKICLFNFNKKKLFYLNPPSGMILANASKAGVQLVVGQTVQQLDDLKNELDLKMMELPLHCCTNTDDLESTIRAYLKQ